MNNDTNLTPAKNKYTLNFKLKVLKEYECTNISQKNLAEKYNVSLAALQRWCYKFKITKKVKQKIKEPKIEILEKFQNDICERYKNKEKINSLMSYYNTSRNLILKLLKRYNIQIRNNNEEQRKYTFNYDYFSKIDTQEKSYWLGFLFADGCVSSNKRVTLGLQQNDKEHIIKFCNSIQRSSDNLYYCKKTKSYKLTLCSGKMAKDLMNLGCINNKSLVLQFPDKCFISESFIFSFIRGYFDGDGCIHLLNKGLNAVISFVGTNIFLQKLKSILEEHGIICNIYKINHCQAYQLSFSSKQSVEIFYNLIYPNKDVINLNRKHEKFLNYFKIKNENFLNKFKKSKHKWFDKRRNTWYVVFTKNKKRIRFGPFKTEKEADITKLNYEEQNKIGCWN